jgi:L-fuconate dehydratase
MRRIISATAHDIRFPTSRTLAGSDAMHKAPDYSAAYVVLRTDAGDQLEGHGLTFTAGRGTEVCVAAINALAPLIVGKTLESITADMRGFWHAVTGEQQLRWLGPEKGVIHLAAAALVNAVWDLYAKVEGKPLWKLLVDMSPEELVSCIDFRYISDALTPDEALAILRRMHPTRAKREAEMLRAGFPAYTTSAGWLGYSDEKLRMLCREAVAGDPREDEGWPEDRGRRAPGAHRARGDRIGAPPDDGREPGLGGGRRHRQHEGARRVRAVLDRGADQPG